MNSYLRNWGCYHVLRGIGGIYCYYYLRISALRDPALWCLFFFANLRFHCLERFIYTIISFVLVCFCLTFHVLLFVICRTLFRAVINWICCFVYFFSLQLYCPVIDCADFAYPPLFLLALFVVPLYPNVLVMSLPFIEQFSFSTLYILCFCYIVQISTLPSLHTGLVRNLHVWDAARSIS